MFHNKKDILLLTGYTSWCLLGFKRGLESYEYFFKYNVYSDVNYNYTYLYSGKLLNGCFGTILYASPIFIIPMMVKEVYRLEVNLRNLEAAKKSDYYNELI
jgi:hypothetical protein